MKTVNSSKYNENYYKNAYGKSIFSKKLGYYVSSRINIYKELTNLLILNSNDLVIDYGCGNGDLSFYLASKYKCKVVGIDYSKEAINICKRKIKNIKNKSLIKFFNYNNKDVPNYKNVKVVFFCDVIEHMYDEEIKFVLNKVKKWSKRVKVAIHTDNNIYLTYINPILNFFYLLLRKKSIEQIKYEKKLEKELHVNLTNPSLLTKKMKKFGFRKLKITYPLITKEKIKKQLSTLSKLPFLVLFAYYGYKLLKFLRPTFYALYEYNGDN